MNEPVYRIENLTKVYEKSGVTANSNINLKISPGQIFGIFGPNGAGKTTLVKQMAGLIKPSSGNISLNGQNIITNPDLIPHHISYFSQTPWILWSHRVWEAIYFTGLFRGLTKKEAKKQTDSLLLQLGLESIRYHLMERISEGQSKMLGIATALIGYRPVMILDEPTNHLDPANRAMLWNTLTELCQSRGTTIILVTHNITEAEKIVDQVAIIDKGQLIASGTPGELKSAISDRIRLMISSKDKTPGIMPGCLEKQNGAHELKPGYWTIQVKREEAADKLSSIMSSTDFENLEDIRMLTTTLEDVYLHYGGRSSDFIH